MNRRRASTRVVLALSLVLLALGVVATLAHSPPLRARTNGVQTSVEFGSVTDGHFGVCQAGEVLPAGATAVRLSLDSVLGPRVTVRIRKDGRLLTSGVRGAGWTAADVTVPLEPLAHTVTGVQTCFGFLARDESVGLIGQRLGRATAAATPHDPGLLKVEYLRPGRRSWWSLASEVAEHLGVGHAWSGSWIVPFLIATMAAVVALMSWLALRLAR